MDRIVLLGINARYSHTNPALRYLKSNIDAAGLYTGILEYTISESAEKISKEVSLIKPDLLGISVYIWNAPLVKKIIKTVKSSLPELKIVLGGPEVSYNSAEWIAEFNEIDCVIAGGGESAFSDFILSGGTGRGIIKGNNPHFSRIKFPYTDQDMKDIRGRYVYYESSRGCPFSCSYCLSSVKERSVEFRTTGQVADELDFFLPYDLPLVKFVDRTFNLKKEHYMPVWEHIVKRYSGRGTCFHFEIFPELLDDDDLKFLSVVPRGLFQFEMGIQSAKNETLKEINRSSSWDRLEKNIRRLSEAGNIHLHTDLIAGLPYEGFTDYRESFNKVYSLGADHLQGGFLKVLPGTVMRARSEEYGMEYNPLPPYEIIRNRWITSGEINKIKLISELVDLLHNGGRFTETEKFLVSIYGGPFSFFNRAADFFKKDQKASHRQWERLAVILFSMVKTDHPALEGELTDCLRWDWCSSMKHHHYPEILRSEATVEAKKKGYRFFHGLIEERMVMYNGLSFPADDLRRSIFFSPETDSFRREKMSDEMAVFLPDKRVVFFSCN